MLVAALLGAPRPVGAAGLAPFTAPARVAALERRAVPDEVPLEPPALGVETPTLARIGAAADTSAADTTLGIRDTTHGLASRRRGAATAKPASRFSKPRWVMLRSLVVPGWGQAYNRAWLKAGLIAGGEGALISMVVNDQSALDRLLGDVARAQQQGDLDLENQAVAAYNHRLDATNARQYLLGAVVIYSLVDAYVDAHFRNFKIEFESDPALPHGASRAEARVGWELRF